MDDIKISLAAARVNARLKQEDVARIMHISKNTIVNWEKGKVIPSLSNVYMLSTIYNIPPNNIFLPEKST